MKKIITLVCLALSFCGQAQYGINQLTTTEPKGGELNGTIFTTDKQVAVGVTIAIKNSNRATTTDERGYFSFTNLKEGAYTIIVSMVGLQTQEQVVTVSSNRTSSIEIILIEDAKKLNEILVASGRKLNNKPLTAGKIAIHPMDLPQSITVIGSSFIREQQAQRLSEVVKNVNGVYLATTRGNVQESFSARGYSFGSNNLYKNGARVNSGAMPEMSGLEKVEVLKGSAAILFGQVAPGGILNMVTKQPKFTQGGEVSMRAGSYGLFKPSVDVYGPLNTNIAYRLNGSFETANSFRDNVSSKRYYANPSLLFRLGRHTELITEGDYLYHRFTPDFGIGSLNNTLIPHVPRSRFMGTSWQYNTTQQVTGTATLKHSFNEAWKLNGSFSYQYYDRDYFSTERIQADANGEWVRPLGKIQTTENYYTVQVNLNGKFSTGKMEHIFLAGADADDDVIRNNDFSFPAVAGLTSGSYDKINILDPGKYVQRNDVPDATMIRKRKSPLNRYGMFVQDLVKITSKLNLLAGVRWSYVATLGIDSLNLVNGNTSKGQNRYDNAFSPRLGLVFKPTPNTSVFASYANSFTVNTGQDIDGAALKPSIIDQYEAGMKNEFFNGQLSANVTVYRIVNHKLAQMAPFLRNGTANSNSNIKEMTGQTTSDGVELDLAAHPVSGLDITAGYSYNYTRYTKTANTAGSYKTGERLVNNPAHTGNITAMYTLKKTSLKGLKIGASAYYIGNRYGGWNNTVGQTQNYSRLIPVKGFYTIDLTAGYSYKKLGLMARVTNVTNTLNYYVHENYSINPIPPAQVVATISYKF